MEECKIVFIVHGKEHIAAASAGESVLEVALKESLEPPYSCLEGVCGTCSAYLECGEVIQAEGLVNEASAERIFRTCQAQPKSAFLKVNYDKSGL
jgi:ferredoxin